MRRSPRSPSWSAPPSTCTPTASPHSRCGTPAPPGTTPSRSSTRWCATRATRCRTRCWSTSPTRWTASAGSPWRTTRCTGWSSPRPTAPCSRRSSARRGSRRCWVRGSTRTPSSSTPRERGQLKQALLKVGWPAEDLAGYVDGQAHPIELDQSNWHLRDYQQQAVEGFWAGGSGVVVLPCGAGKTLVGAAAMARRRPPR